MADCAFFTYYRPHWSCRGTLGDSWVTSGNVRAPGVMKGRGVSEEWGGRCRASPGACTHLHGSLVPNHAEWLPWTVVTMDCVDGYVLHNVIPPGLHSVMSSL